MRLLLLAIPLLLSACRGPAMPVMQAPDAMPALAEHRVLLTKGKRTRALWTHWETKSGRFAFVGFGPLGETEFECRSLDADVRCSGKVPFSSPEELLENMRLAYLPVEALRATFPSGNFAVSEKGNVREITQNGRLYRRISYAKGDRMSAEATSERPDAGYWLRIRPLRIEQGNRDG
jgi:hypothetical protein